MSKKVPFVFFAPRFAGALPGSSSRGAGSCGLARTAAWLEES
jgi:hypothetical protein